MANPNGKPILKKAYVCLTKAEKQEQLTNLKEAYNLYKEGAQLVIESMKKEVHSDFSRRRLWREWKVHLNQARALWRILRKRREKRSARLSRRRDATDEILVDENDDGVDAQKQMEQDQMVKTVKDSDGP